MNKENLIIEKIHSVAIGDEFITRVNEAVLHSVKEVNEKEDKYLDMYVLMRDADNDVLVPAKIRINTPKDIEVELLTEEQYKEKTSSLCHE